MEELVQKIDELIKALNRNSMPLWLAIIGMIVPIVISILVMGFAIYQYKQNKKLQKAISEKELRVQMHGDVLSIYDNHFIANTVLSKAKNGVAAFFAYPSIFSQWNNELFNATSLVCQTNNRARLLLPQSDELLITKLKDILEQLNTLNKEINEYINSGKAEYYRQQAWSIISATYQIPMYDYNSLSFNRNATEDLIKLCSNDDTNKIDSKITELLKLYDYDEFDKYFVPYLRMYTEKGEK